MKQQQEAALLVAFRRLCPDTRRRIAYSIQREAEREAERELLRDHKPSFRVINGGKQ